MTLNRIKLYSITVFAKWPLLVILLVIALLTLGLTLVGDPFARLIDWLEEKEMSYARADARKSQVTQQRDHRA